MISSLIRQTKNKLSAYSVHVVTELNFIFKCLETINHEFNFEGLFAKKQDNFITLQDKMGQTFVCMKLPDGWQIYMNKSDTLRVESTIKNLECISLIEDAPYIIPDFLCNFHTLDRINYFIPEYSGNLKHFNDLLNCLDFYKKSLGEKTNQKLDLSVDTNSHDYQLKSTFFQVYYDDKMSFYHHAFLVLGGGYYWDKEGNLTSGNTPYNEEVQRISIEDIPIGQIEVLYPSFTDNNLLRIPANATKEWKQAKIEFVKELKRLVNEFPTWEASKQQEFFGSQDGKPIFAIEDLELMISKC